MNWTEVWRDNAKPFLHLNRVVGDTVAVDPLGHRALRVRATHGSFFAKWLPAGDPLSDNELNINRRVLPSRKLLTPRLVTEIQLQAGAWGVWEWLDGSDLRFNRRELLPQVFASLAEFHHEQRSVGPVYSPATRLAYPSASDMLASELFLLTAGADDTVRVACQRHFDVLVAASFPTLIHGDMHPGNVRFTPNGLYVVDWAYALPSLNLLDLDYIESIPIGGESEGEWWRIRSDESGEVLKAYCEACGQAQPDPAVLAAVMVWTALRSHYNLTQQPGHKHDARCYADVVSLLA